MHKNTFASLNIVSTQSGLQSRLIQRQPWMAWTKERFSYSEAKDMNYPTDVFEETRPRSPPLPRPMAVALFLTPDIDFLERR